MVDLVAAHSHSLSNQAEIEASKNCGCFFCMEIFPAEEISAWTTLQVPTAEELEAGGALTAICPHCGSESVIGDKSGYPITAQFLNLMHQAWYQKTILYKPQPKK
jgi:hypothetical protein